MTQEEQRLRAVLKAIADSDTGWVRAGLKEEGIRDGRMLGAQDLARIALLPDENRPLLYDPSTWEPVAELNGAPSVPGRESVP